jgi:tetratricopeptide (TPR) repeat protein
LSTALQAKGQVDEAIAYYRKARALDPKNAKNHFYLGYALQAKGLVDEAITCYRKTLALDPKYASAHHNLGLALQAKGRPEDAIASYRKAIALDPKNAIFHFNLGPALAGKGRMDEAIACFRKAIALKPKYAAAHTNLGLALAGKGRLDEAIACFRKALALDPKYAGAHNNLVVALKAKGRLDEAIACYRKAIALDPGDAVAHCNLGHALQSQGRFAEALAALKRGHHLGRKRPGGPHPSARWVRRCRHLLELDSKLAAVLAGTARLEGPGQRLDFAGICIQKQRHAAAARFFAEAFQLQPKLADDLAKEHRYNAACAAALAAAGQGKDAGKLDAKERARLRRQAFTWLRADLTAWTKLLANDPAAARPTVRKKLRHWQQDSDLACIRDQAALAKLSAEECLACVQLWNDVATLLQKAKGKGK